MRIVFVGLISMLLCVAGAGQKDAPDAKPAKAAQPKKAIVIDVRSTAEYADGHLRGSTNIPVSELSKRIAEVAPDKHTALMVHCQSGTRSARAKKTLEGLGYTNVIDLGSIANARAKVGK